jgi:hypothetical protein
MDHKMKKINKIGIISALVSLTSWLLLSSSVAMAAGSATLSLNPNSGSYNKDDSFTVSIYEDSGAETVNAVQANLTYDAAKLQLTAIDSSSSAFDIKAAESGGGGTINIARAKIGGLSGNQIVSKLTFTALVGSGSTAVNFANSSAIVRASDNTDIWNHDPTGGTYTLTTPTSSTPPTTAPPTTTKSGTTTKPKASNITNSPSTAQQQANPSEPVPANVVTTTTNSTFFVAIKVIDSKGKPVQNATVKLGSDSSKTDINGLASFSNVSAGSYKVTVDATKVKGKSTIVVDASRPATEVQEFQIKATAKYNWELYAGIAGAILVVLIILGLWKGGGGYLSKQKANHHHGLDAMPKVEVGTPETPAPKAQVSSGTDNDNVLKPTVITPNGSGTVPKV